jgi:UDP-glucose 4-epimerase
MAAPILVTGGFGAIGSYVLRRLIDDGHPVVVYSRRANYRLVPDLEGDDRVVHAAGDVQDRDRLHGVAQEHGVRRIIHLAAAVGPELERQPEVGYQVNVIGSLNVFEVAKQLNLERVVFTSSKAYYGSLTGDHAPPTFKAVTEDYVGQTANVYGATKKALEDAAYHYRRLFGLDVIALRLGSTYGPGKDVPGHAGGYSAIKSRMVETAVRGEPLVVPAPDSPDDIVYNHDVAKGAVLACFAPPTAHWQFNIAGGRLVTLRQLGDEIKRLAPEHQLSYLEPDGDGASQKPLGNTASLLSIDRARAELGYEPDFPGVSAIADYVSRYRFLQAAGRQSDERVSSRA